MIRVSWPLALAMLVAPCAAQRNSDIDSLIGRGELVEAERVARAGGDSTAAWHGEVLVLLARPGDAKPILERAARGGVGARRATAILAELAARRGDRTEVARLADPLAREWLASGTNWSADDHLSAGRVLRLLGAEDPHAVRDALRAFDAASQADPRLVEGELRAADLFLERYNSPDAVEGYRAVLAKRAGDARAMVGLARAAAFSNRPAMGLLREALAVDRRSLAGRLLLFRLHIDAEHYDSAAAAAESAVAIDSTSIDAWAAKASLAWLADDSVAFALAEARVRELNPIPAAFYAAIADAAGRHRRYAAAAELARKGVSLDSNSVPALGALGNNLLRVGRIAEGREAIERAFEIDPFHLWHKNTLDLLDELAGFETVRTDRFEIVSTAEDAELLAALVGPLLEEAYDALSRRYDYLPPTPIRLEFYDRHADFSVRTIGLAGLGALGVSFGTVLVMDAPDARPAGEFNVGSTAWHELAHTFTLGKSENRVPRWFSEGLSVLEERRAKPGWGAHASIGFIRALATDSLLPIAELNDGFVQPDSPGRVGLSYYQASLAAEYIELRAGVEGIREMLLGYAGGGDTESVLTAATGLSAADFDQGFLDWLTDRFGTALRAFGAGDPGVFAAPLGAGVSAMNAGDTAAAVSLLRSARERFPEYGGADGPALPLAIALWASGDRTDALRELTAVTNQDETALNANLLETNWRLELRDSLGALDAIGRASWISPYRGEIWRQRAELASQLADHSVAVLSRRAVVGLRPADPIAARTDLASSLLDAGRLGEARRVLLAVLERAPAYERAQGLLLRLRNSERDQ